MKAKNRLFLVLKLSDLQRLRKRARNPNQKGTVLLAKASFLITFFGYEQKNKREQKEMKRQQTVS